MTPPWLAVDANPIIAALLFGKAGGIFRSADTRFVTTERTIWEVRRCFPMIRAKCGTSEELLLRDLEELPITAFHPREYDAALARARRLIGSRDADDAELLALGLALDIPIWSNDKDFRGLPGVTVYTTDDLARMLDGTPGNT